MQPSKQEIYAYQLLYYLVTKHQYQIVTIKQQKEDIWLMNAQHSLYPVVRLSSSSNADTLTDTDYLRNAHRAILDLIHRESKLFILNTNEDSTPIENEILKQVCINPNRISDTTLGEVYPEIEMICSDVEDANKEYVRLTRALEEKQMQMVKSQRKAMHSIKKVPPITLVIGIICVLYCIVVNVVAFNLENANVAAILSGAYYKLNVVGLHEYWRFFTAGFMHFDVLHLAINMIAFVNLGTAMERVFKKWQYISILLASILVGNIFAFICEGNILALGISGGLFGLLGAYIVCLFENGSIRHPLVRANVMKMVMINIFVSLMPGISGFAHLGGFLCGAFMSVILLQSKRWEHLKIHVAASFAILLGILGWCTTQVSVVAPLHPEVDAQIISITRDIGFDWYADRLEAGYQSYYIKEIVE